MGSCESIPDFTPAVEAASDFSEAPTLNEIILQSQMLVEFESAASNDTNFEYTIGGQVSQTTGNALNLNGLIIPVQFSPWVKDASGPWLQVPFDEFEFECVALRDPVTRQDFCDTVEFVTTDEGVNIAFGNVVLCPSCSLTGDENGVMFTIGHKGGRELDFRAPVIQSPFLAGSGMSLGDAGTPVDAGAMETEFGNGARGKQCSADSVRVCSGQGNALVPSPAMSDLQPMFEAQMSSTMPASVLTEEERASPELFVSGTVIASGFSTLCLEGVSVFPDAPDRVRLPRSRCYGQSRRFHSHLPGFQGGWPGARPRHGLRQNGLPLNDRHGRPRHLPRRGPLRQLQARGWRQRRVLQRAAHPRLRTHRPC